MILEFANPQSVKTPQRRVTLYLHDAAPSDEPKILNSFIQSGRFFLEFETAQGFRYQGNMKSPISSGTWIGIGTPVNGDGGMKVISDDISSSQLQQRFYRIRKTPL